MLAMWIRSGRKPVGLVRVGDQLGVAVLRQWLDVGVPRVDAERMQLTPPDPVQDVAGHWMPRERGVVDVLDQCADRVDGGLVPELDRRHGPTITLPRSAPDPDDRSRPGPAWARRVSLGVEAQGFDDLFDRRHFL
jgi:hypothetical protein